MTAAPAGSGPASGAGGHRTGTDELTGAAIVAALGLEPLPGEGGHWTQTWIDEHGTGIYFLLQPHDFSAFHRLAGPELYHYHGGAPAELYLLHPDGSSERLVLGMDLAAGQRPCRPVPGGVWQGSRTLGSWTLLGCTMAPPFRFDDFELGHRDQLLAAYPDQREIILALTRDAGPDSAGRDGAGGDR